MVKNFLSIWSAQKTGSDNGKQFQGQKVLAWCKYMKIDQRFTLVAYPQANGQTEVTNWSIVQPLKSGFMESGKTGWNICPVYYEHTEPLQGHPRLTPPPPFSMVYGSEAMLPAEIGEASARVRGYDEENGERRAHNLDMIEKDERRL